MSPDSQQATILLEAVAWAMQMTERNQKEIVLREALFFLHPVEINKLSIPG